MSRIGKKPIPLPEKVKFAVSGQTVNVEGPKGKLSFDVHPVISVKQDGTNVVVERPNDERQSKALHGLTRALVANMIIGVTDGYRKVMELRGVGFKAELKGKVVAMSVGRANQALVPVPAGLTVTVEPGQGEIQNRIVVVGSDKQQVGNFAAELRRVRKPEPYKGKGVRYEGEVVKIKPGKAFAGAGAK